MASILRRGSYYFRFNARYSTQATKNTTYAAAKAATAAGHGDGGTLLKVLSFFAAFPGVGVGMLNAACFTHEGLELRERTPFASHEHRRVSAKHFPWRDDQESPSYSSPRRE